MGLLGVSGLIAMVLEWSGHYRNPAPSRCKAPPQTQQDGGTAMRGANLALNAPVMSTRDADHGTWAVDAEYQGQRLDAALSKRIPQTSRQCIQGAAREGRIRVNGKLAQACHRLASGDCVAWRGPLAREFTPLPDASRSVAVVYADEHLLVANKEAGMHCHPLQADEVGTLMQHLLARYPELETVRGYGRRELGLVHRLDRDTSGLVLVARHTGAFARLVELLRIGGIDKRYLALCSGQPPRGELRWGLRATGARGQTLKADPSFELPGATVIVQAQPLAHWAGIQPQPSLVTLQLRRGYRHQIRAHLAALGHPLIGDRQYGGRRLNDCPHHLLHAESLRFVHPFSGAEVIVQTAPEGVFADIAQDAVLAPVAD